jgi:CRP-like cAMP-binding protein
MSLDWMSLDWFTNAGSSENVADLVRRRRFKKALKTLREEFDKGNRSIGLRLQFADILRKTGRTDQAIPILLGLASELHAAGEPGRAEDLLRQAEALEPDRPDIARKRRAFALAAQRKKREEQAAAAPDIVFFREEDSSPEPPPPAAFSSTPDPPVDEDSVYFNNSDPASLGTPIPTEAEVAAALAQAEATTVSDEWVELDGEADPEVLVAQWKTEPSIADVAEMAVAQGFSDKQVIVDCVLDLALRFPLPLDEPPNALHLAGALFEGLDEEQVRDLVAGLRRQAFETGAIMVREGERGDSVFILVRGRARVTAAAAHGGSYEVGELEEGSFFGEISIFGGRRTATVVAVGPCETLEIAAGTFESLALCRPVAKEIVEQAYLQRTNSPEVEAIRAVPAMHPETPGQALRWLDEHLGHKTWNPKTRLRLAELLAKTGPYEDVVPVLVGLADEMMAAGQAARALAILHKIEVIEGPGDGEIHIAPLPYPPAPRREGPGGVILTFLAAGRPAPSAKAIEHFRRFLQDLMREARGEAPAEAEPGLLGAEVEELLGPLDLDRLATKAAAKPVKRRRTGRTGKIAVGRRTSRASR